MWEMQASDQLTRQVRIFRVVSFVRRFQFPHLAQLIPVFGSCVSFTVNFSAACTSLSLSFCQCRLQCDSDH